MTSFVSQPCLIGSPNIQQGLKFRKHQGIPGIEITSSGKLFATWYANNIAGEGPGNYAILAVSGDHGLSWKEVKTITPAAENVRVFDPVLWLAPNGILWWSWSQSFSQAIGDVYDGFAGVWVSCCNDIESDDLIWSAPRRIGHGIMMNKPTVMRDGSWVFPTAIWSCYPDKTPEELRTLNRSNFLISHDNGKSF